MKNMLYRACFPVKTLIRIVNQNIFIKQWFLSLSPHKHFQMMLLHNVLPTARWQTTTTNSFIAFSKFIAYLLSSIFLKPVSMTRKDNYSVEHLFPLLFKKKPFRKSETDFNRNKQHFITATCKNESGLTSQPYHQAALTE